VCTRQGLQCPEIKQDVKGEKERKRKSLQRAFSYAKKLSLFFRAAAKSFWLFKMQEMKCLLWPNITFYKKALEIINVHLFIALHRLTFFAKTKQTTTQSISKLSRQHSLYETSCNHKSEMISKAMI